MRRIIFLELALLAVGFATLSSHVDAKAAHNSTTLETSATEVNSSKSAASDDDGKAPRQIEVTADESLEWYQDKHIYVARGNAKAVRGEMVVEADLLTAHEREKPEDVPNQTPEQKAALKKKAAEEKAAAKSKVNAGASDNGSGDIDKMTADGNVRITDPRQRVTGDHGVYDLDTHVMVMTGNNLKYETEKDTVTAKDSLEYFEDKKIAVARGHAIGIRADRHIEGDVLTAEFHDTPTEQNALWKMTADGNVVVITKSDVSRGDHMVFDAVRNIAVLRDHVRITRADGTQLAGDVGEVDFANNQSRLLNSGHGRVRALLGAKSGPKGGASGKPPDGKTVVAGSTP